MSGQISSQTLSEREPRAQARLMPSQRGRSRWFPVSPASTDLGPRVHNYGLLCDCTGEDKPAAGFDPIMAQLALSTRSQGTRQRATGAGEQMHRRGSYIGSTQ